jgi:hypothetical protein
MSHHTRCMSLHQYHCPMNSENVRIWLPLYPVFNSPYQKIAFPIRPLLCHFTFQIPAYQAIATYTNPLRIKHKPVIFRSLILLCLPNSCTMLQPDSPLTSLHAHIMVIMVQILALFSLRHSLPFSPECSTLLAYCWSHLTALIYRFVTTEYRIFRSTILR